MSDITLQRHLFTEAFSYGLEPINPKKAISEMTHLIPIISLPNNSSKLIYSLKDRMEWEKSAIDLKRFSFDEEFSNYRLFKYVVHAIGLGILLVPVRIVATYMKSYDEKNGRTCPYDSPYHPCLNPKYVPPPNIKKHATNQMFDFKHLEKYGIDPEQLRKDVELRIEFTRSTQKS